MFWKCFAVVCLLVTVAAGVLVLNRTSAEPAPSRTDPAICRQYDRTVATFIGC